MLLTGLFVGALAGVLLSLPIVYLALRRSVRRARLAERRARGAERMAEIGAMTGGLAHEIKNPLSTIGLNAQLLGEAIAELPIDQADHERLGRRLGVVRREAERLRDILEGFLRFAGALRLETKPTDLAAVVDEIADFYLPQAQRQGVQLRVDRPDQPVRAVVDVAHIKQALLNLMINATQAMATRDDAPLSADSPMRELILKTESGRDVSGPVARIHVIDTGPGIPPETIEQIFTPYFTTKSGGTGLGLPISKRIIDEHSGRLEVRSEVGKGTDFVIILPAYRGA